MHKTLDQFLEDYELSPARKRMVRGVVLDYLGEGSKSRIDVQIAEGKKPPQRSKDRPHYVYCEEGEGIEHPLVGENGSVEWIKFIPGDRSVVVGEDWLKSLFAHTFSRNSEGGTEE